MTTNVSNVPENQQPRKRGRHIVKKSTGNTLIKAWSQKKPKKKLSSVRKYNQYIYTLIEEDRINKAIHQLREMENDNLKPDVRTYTMIIKGFSNRSDMERARKWLSRMQRERVEPDVYTYTALIDGYMRGADLDHAEFMFRSMMEKGIKPTIVTYNVLMHHSVKQLNMESGLKFWENLLKAGLRSDVYTFAIIIHGLGKSGRVDEAWRIFKTMEEEKVNVNHVVATTLVGMHVKQHDNENAIKLFHNFFDAQSPYKFTLSDHTRVVLLNAVISNAEKQTIHDYYDQYNNASSSPDAKLSTLFVTPNVFAYTSFMRAFLRHDDLAMVTQVYNDMMARRIKPTLVTYATLMLAHAFVPNPEACNRIMDELKNGGVQLNSVLYTITMRAWAKAGRLDMVKATYEDMKANNIEAGKLTMEVLRWAGSRSS
jgi:pentatricopeptide repeat protein